VWALLIAVCVLVPVVLVVIATHHDGTHSSALDPPASGLLPTNAVKAGDRAPTFHLTTLDGHPIDTKTLIGKPYIVTFWGSWCGPCQKEMPTLQKAYAEHNGTLPIVGVTFEDPASDSRAFVQQHDITFPVAPDDGIAVASAYGVGGAPTTFFVNRHGVVTDRVFGIESTKELNPPLNRLLASS
jgi:cytochrome c biogenesis protein CcmG, thiol:disulfide interchange protein DsbE